MILIRQMLFLMVDPGDLHFECYKLLGGRTQPVAYSFGATDREIYVQLIVVGNDESVVTAVRDYAPRMKELGYQLLALRDIYGSAYLSRAGRTVSSQVVEQMIEAITAQTTHLDSDHQRTMHFSVMEIEAWILAMCELLEATYPALTESRVEEILGYKLSEIDPEERFLHPSKTLGDLAQHVGGAYSKGQDCANAIASNLTLDHIESAIANGRCRRMSEFIVSLQAALRSR